MRSSRATRMVRGTIAGALATFVALFSHLLAGGSVPGALNVALPLIMSIWVCILLAWRNLSMLRLAISVVISQALFHALFTINWAGLSAAGNQQSGAHHAHGMSDFTTHVHPAATAGVHPMTSDTTMGAWHALAAAITVLLLYRGELLLERLRTFATRVVNWLAERLASVPGVVPERPARVALPVLHDNMLSCRRDLTALRRRGPPLAFK